MNEQAEINPNKKYSALEAAQILGVNDSTIRRWAAKGVFANLERIGPLPRSPFVIPGSSLIAVIEKRKIN